jgi:hypothetical protein
VETRNGFKRHLHFCASPRRPLDSPQPYEDGKKLSRIVNARLHPDSASVRPKKQLRFAKPLIMTPLMRQSRSKVKNTDRITRRPAFYSAHAAIVAQRWRGLISWASEGSSFWKRRGARDRGPTFRDAARLHQLQNCTLQVELGGADKNWFVVHRSPFPPLIIVMLSSWKCLTTKC